MAVRAVHNHAFTEALLSALGLKGRKIVSLSLHLKVDECITVDLTELVDEPSTDDIDGIRRLTYRLEEIADCESELTTDH